jgi:hypothetical protein
MMNEFGYAVLGPQLINCTLIGSVILNRSTTIQVTRAPPAAINQWYPKFGRNRRRINITKEVITSKEIEIMTNMLSIYSKLVQGV